MRILPVDVCSIATSSWVGNMVKLSGNNDKFIMMRFEKKEKLRQTKRRYKSKN